MHLSATGMTIKHLLCEQLLSCRSAEGKVLVVQLQVQGQSYAIPFSNHDPLQSRDGGNSSGLT
jgi:hypothetical protein